MKKIDNKGFALVETLIVATFVMGIFTLIFTNYFPMMGEYEKRERYDDIDSVYNTYLIKKMLENSGSSSTAIINLNLNQISAGKGFVAVNCSIYNNTEYLDYCQNLFTNTGVSSLIITSYNLSNLKSNLDSKLPNSYQDFKDYISSLPDYTKETTTESGKPYVYRIIARYTRVVNSEDKDNQYEIYSYSTIGVDL